jgi:mono/diheme cytochrome c family protein
LLFAVSTSRADESVNSPGSRGEYLARAGDCVACHSVPGGKAFAGGLKMGTPLGAIYATNITPDPETGIGTYSLEDFDRAVRQGIAKDGHRLYPAMPYPSYAKLTDADVGALYDFFTKAVPPVHQANLQNEIPPMLSFRWPIAIWSLVFTTSGSYVAKSDHDADWNRGAYLVQGLGHCGACHTPRGFAWQEKALDDSNTNYLSGAMLDAWYAPDLRGDARTGLGSWSKDNLVDFLKHGHGRGETAFGSMIDVVNNSTPYLSDSDINAIAVYLKSLSATSTQQTVTYDDATTAALRSGHALQPGGTIYAGTCANCHGFDGKGFGPYTPALAGNPIVLDDDPSSLINLVLNGSNPLASKVLRTPIACRNSVSSTPTRRSPTLSPSSAPAGATKRRRSRPRRSPNYARRPTRPAIRSSSSKCVSRSTKRLPRSMSQMSHGATLRYVATISALPRKRI